MVSPLVQALSYQNSVNPSQTGVAPTDVVGAYKLSSDVAEKNYQAKLAANNAMFGGLAGLGGAGVLAFGGPAAKSLFAATPSAASAAAPALPSAALAPTASGTAAAWPTSFGAGATGLGGGGSVAADLGATAAPTVAADLGAAGAGAAGAGSIAADLGIDAAGAGAAEAAAAGLPEWLASILPFLALA